MAIISKKKTTFAITAALAAVVVTFTPSIASAQDVSDGIIEIQPGTSQAVTETIISDALDELAGTQTQEEIDALLAMGNTTVLVDGETNEDLSAVHMETPLAQGRAISILSP